jgi:hypothetical protein
MAQSPSLGLGAISMRSCSKRRQNIDLLNQARADVAMEIKAG